MAKYTAQKVARAFRYYQKWRQQCVFDSNWITSMTDHATGINTPTVEAICGTVESLQAHHHKAELCAKYLLDITEATGE
jgi:hypothetical protein